MADIETPHWIKHWIVFHRGGWAAPMHINEKHPLHLERWECFECKDWFAADTVAIITPLQDEEGGRPTKFFCRQWRDRFELTIPVLIDQTFTTETYFDAAQTPLNLLIDSDGIIRYRQTGVAPHDLAEQIESLLDE